MIKSFLCSKLFCSQIHHSIRIHLTYSYMLVELGVRQFPCIYICPRQSGMVYMYALFQLVPILIIPLCIIKAHVICKSWSIAHADLLSGKIHPFIQS